MDRRQRIKRAIDGLATWQYDSYGEPMMRVILDDEFEDLIDDIEYHLDTDTQNETL